MRSCHVNKYICLLAAEAGDLPTASAIQEAPTHVLAAKMVEKDHPGMVVVEVMQRWYPLAKCARCGGPIFRGDYQDDRIRNRSGAYRCLECE